jgi:hypothetical protein
MEVGQGTNWDCSAKEYAEKSLRLFVRVIRRRYL